MANRTAIVVPWRRRSEALDPSMRLSQPGCPWSIPTTRPWRAIGDRPDPTRHSRANRAQSTTQMALAALTPTDRAATNGRSVPCEGHNSTASTA